MPLLPPSLLPPHAETAVAPTAQGLSVGRMLGLLGARQHPEAPALEDEGGHVAVAPVEAAPCAGIPEAWRERAPALPRVPPFFMGVSVESPACCA